MILSLSLPGISSNNSLYFNNFHVNEPDLNNLAYLFFIVIFCGLVSGTRFFGLDSGIDAGLVWDVPHLLVVQKRRKRKNKITKQKQLQKKKEKRFSLTKIP